MMAACLAVMEALIPLAPPLLLSVFVDGIGAGMEFGTLAAIAVGGVVCLFLMNALRGKMFRGGLPHTEYCNDLVEWKYNEKSMEMDYAQLDSTQTAALRAQVQNDADWGCGAYYMIPQFQNCLTGILGIAVSAVLLIGAAWNADFWKHWSAFAFLLYVAAVTVVSAVYEQHARRVEEELREKYDKTSSRSNYLMHGGITYREGKDIRIYSAQPLVKSALQEAQRDRMVDQESAMEQKAGALDGAFSGILLGGAYLFIVLRALDGALSAGMVVLFASAVYRLSESMKTLFKGRSEIWMNARRMESSFQFLELPQLLESGHRSVSAQDAEGEIVFEDVTFCYPGTDTPALSHVSFRLQPGRKTAVVGMNGSGKTTLVKLLCRLYDPDEGRILLNGVDIREYEYEEYLRQFSVVFQDFKLLSLSLGGNVAASPEWEEGRVKECLEKAGFGARLSGMHKGLHTALYRDMEEDGVEVSGGEAQKIALARALYKDAPIVILDEPTAALDPISEHDIYSGFRRLIGDKSAVFISHRLSSCRFCDDILVFHQGCLIQRGSHEELVREEAGKYKEMWQAQAQYYEDGGGSVAGEGSVAW